MRTVESINLLGDISLPEDNTKKVLAKMSDETSQMDASKILKSKKVDLATKIETIRAEVSRILGWRTEETLVIKDRGSFSSYIDKAIENGIIFVDTETNNSLDPLTCILMGPCLCTPGMKQCYIPLNHTDFEGNRLGWQLTENDVREEFQRLIDSNVSCVFHNAKFDYQVIKCTCGIEMPISDDTLIMAQLLNENEKASLKDQYILHIDPSQEKYSIESLFSKISYAIIDPDLFALYASTDAVMTYELWKYQKKEFSKPENSRILSLYEKVELPCIKVLAEMELTGVTLDTDRCHRLSQKYHKSLDELNKEIDKEISAIKPKIDVWRLSKDANARKGTAKSKSEQLEEHINLGSPTQLAILIYDVLGIKPVDKKAPRGTGKEELKKIYSNTKMNLFKLLLEERKLSKLIDAFLDTLPNKLNGKTGRIHCTFKQCGAATGRQSCSEPNLQQIPSKSKDIRLIFKANPVEHVIEYSDGYSISAYDEVEIQPGVWVPASNLKVGDCIGNEMITSINNEGDNLRVATSII